MKSRPFTTLDYWKVKELHNKHYPEFEFPRFDEMLNAYVIEDEEGIIMAGAIENVAEAVLVTNKDRSRVTIGRALVEAQSISLFTCKSFRIHDLYAFVNNDEYAKHLIKHGFREHGLTTLSMKVP
jgi:hypothetical protein